MSCTEEKTLEVLEVTLPAPVAADLIIRAAQVGIDTAEYLGILVLRSAYGALNPTVTAFEQRAKAGKVGAERDGE